QLVATEHDSRPNFRALPDGLSEPVEMIDESRGCVGLVSAQDYCSPHPLKLIKAKVRGEQDVADGLLLLVHPEGHPDSYHCPRVEHADRLVHRLLHGPDAARTHLRQSVVNRRGVNRPEVAVDSVLEWNGDRPCACGDLEAVMYGSRLVLVDCYEQYIRTRG